MAKKDPESDDALERGVLELRLILETVEFARKKCAGIEGCGELFAALTAFVATRSNALAKTQHLEKQTIKDEEK
ncbi:MAG: hypothetical protein IJY15_13165 [Thermoguttaceae bacterium]|nr:hypothetical protein [Thermoguttaceae bacterium]